MAAHTSRRDDALSSTGDSSTGLENEDEVDATDRFLLQLKNGLFGVLVRAFCVYCIADFSDQLQGQ